VKTVHLFSPLVDKHGVSKIINTPLFPNRR